MLDVRGSFKDKRTRLLIIVGVVLLVVMAGAVVYFYQQYRQTQQNAPEQNKTTVSRIVDKVSKLLQVPTDEEPQVALIADPDQLKSQTFYASVQKDDYVLVYQKAQLAIIYREKDNKLINVDHVQVGQAPAPAATKK